MSADAGVSISPNLLSSRSSELQTLAVVRHRLKRIAYHCYTSAERASARHNYFRQLTAAEWKTLYGRDFQYSSDYVHAFPDAFGASARLTAQLANRTEELAEILFRFSGCIIRSTASIFPHTLRDLPGRGRFAARVCKALASQSNSSLKLSENACRAVFDLLHKQGDPKGKAWVNSRGFLLRPVDDQMLDALVCGLKNQRGLLGASTLQASLDGLLSALEEPDPGLRDAARTAFSRALRSADLTRSMAHLSLPAKMAMSLGCSLSVAATTSLSFAINVVAQSVATAWLAKIGFLAASLYATSFVLRLGACGVARLTRSHIGRLGSAQTPKAYASLFDVAASSLLNARNLSYARWNSSIKRSFLISRFPDHVQQSLMLQKADDVRWQDEERSASYVQASVDPQWPLPVRALAGLSAGLHRVSDVLFSLDRVIGQGLVSRPAKYSLFRYHGELRHAHGISANGKCNYDMKFHKAAGTTAGHIRRGLASLIGHGGADVLGMAVGCAAYSVCWTSLNLLIPGGALVTVVATEGTDLVLSLAMAGACSVAWGASALAEGGMNGAMAVHGSFSRRSKVA
jgi:hypothetical protein